MLYESVIYIKFYGIINLVSKQIKAALSFKVNTPLEFRKYIPCFTLSPPNVPVLTPKVYQDFPSCFGSHISSPLVVIWDIDLIRNSPSFNRAESEEEIPK